MMQAPPGTKPLWLQLPTDIALKVTTEQFVALSTINQDLRLERTAAGQLIVNPPTGGHTGFRNFSLIAQFGVWFEANEPLGKAFDSSTGFELPNGACRSPDLSWVRQDRWHSLTAEQREGFLPVCPDFVVELRSKTDSIKQLRLKMEEYIENGARLGWLIDPEDKHIEIYRPGQAVEILNRPSTISGETVVPGFTLSLERIWR